MFVNESKTVINNTFQVTLCRIQSHMTSHVTYFHGPIQ